MNATSNNITTTTFNIYNDDIQEKGQIESQHGIGACERLH